MIDIICLLRFSTTSDRLLDKLFADLEDIISPISVLLRSLLLLLLLCFDHLFKLGQTEDIWQTSVFHLEWHLLKYWNTQKIIIGELKFAHKLFHISKHTGLKNNGDNGHNSKGLLWSDDQISVFFVTVNS